MAQSCNKEENIVKDSCESALIKISDCYYNEQGIYNMSHSNTLYIIDWDKKCTQSVADRYLQMSCEEILKDLP